MTTTLSDLPIHILEKVVGYRNLQESLILRKVCHTLRDLVDSNEVFCDRIEFKFEAHILTMKFGDLILKYHEVHMGGCRVTAYKNSTHQVYTYWYKENFKQVMVADVATFLGNPKLKIGHIGFEVKCDESVAGFFVYLKSLEHQLSVQTIHNKSQRCITPILHFLNQDELEEIVIENADITVSKFKKIAKMEQWVTKMRLRGCCIPRGIGLQKFRNFKEIDVEFEVIDEDLIKIRDILLKSPHLEDCEFTASNYRKTEDEAYQRFHRIMIQDPAFDALNCRFLIPDTRDYFQLEFQMYETTSTANEINLTITKVSSN